MKRNAFSRLTAAALALTLLLGPCAQALTVEQAAELLQDFYVDEVPQAVLEEDTIEGMLDALGDPYTEYFSPEEYQTFLDSMSDTSLVGIGIVYTAGEDGLSISEVLEGSPAEAGGLMAGDVIVAVDGNSTKGASSDDATSWIRGEEGSKVKVTYLRDGKKKTVTLTRALVVVPATTSELIDEHIGYISCTTFGSETVGHFREAIEAYGKQATSWIVDLRGNLGGVTSAATEAAGLFCGEGGMSYLRDGEDTYSVFYHEEDSLTLSPVLVLVDEDTASSSEIFASAIQGLGSGIVIGSRTFGKGVAQSVLDKNALPDYFADGDAIKITSNRFFSAIGNTTDQVGVLPDLLAPPELAGDLAWLLAGSTEGAQVEHPLRVDLGYQYPWRWYIDLDVALEEENAPFLEILLNALPAGTRLWMHPESGGSSWERVSVDQVCADNGLRYEPQQFTDHDQSAYPEYLSILKGYGLINGKDDGAFHPQDSLTRAELCQLLAVALRCLRPSNPSPFTDVRDDAWYADAVIAMSNMGIVNGVGDGTFRPEDPVDHQQFLTIMGRLAQRLNMDFYDAAKETPEDAAAMAGMEGYDAWAVPQVWLLTASQTGLFGNPLSLLWDKLPEISAKAPTTRDEAAYMLYTVLSFTGILPV